MTTAKLTRLFTYSHGVYTNIRTPLIILLSVLRFMASDFSFGIFKLFLESGVLFKNVCGSCDP
jgi:hypothetical protein